MARLLLVLIASLLAASCAEVRSSVTVSHMLPAPGSAKTIAILPYAPSLAAAPDYPSYAGKLAAHLEARGYDIVASSAGQPAADYIAFFHYGVDGETPVNLIQSAPVPRTGSIITYGLRGPYGFGPRSYYTRTVILEIVERARFRPNDPQSYLDARVYSGWVKSEGGCGTMAPVIDPMLAALFAEFPGENGGFRQIDLPTDTACGPHRYG